ncbi:MAG TPA: hypothetical protein PK819_11955, partial [Thermomicrobiales bacterium]|nr:hypothetical protein [Thermomicrobiales bacterium]
ISNLTGGALQIAPQGAAPVRIMTPTFIPPEAKAMPGYQMFASPLLYPGQTVTATVVNEGSANATVSLVMRVYGASDQSNVVAGPSHVITTGSGATTIAWTIPVTGGNPIHAIGLEVSGAAIALQRMHWSGAPTVHFHRPADSPFVTWFDQPENGPSIMWRKAFVDAVDEYGHWWKEAFRISQNAGRGVMAQGTSDWQDYRTTSTITPYLAKSFGIAARVQGLKRYYTLVLCDDGMARIIKMDDSESVLAETAFAWDVFVPYEFNLDVNGESISGTVGDVTLTAHDPGTRIRSGSAGFMIEVGTLGAEQLSVSPL